jgi:hypothetical protein
VADTVLLLEEISTAVDLAFTRVLEDEGIMDAIGDRLDRRNRTRPARWHPHPGLLTWSDTQRPPDVTSGDTSTFMALHLIAEHLGRVG